MCFQLVTAAQRARYRRTAAPRLTLLTLLTPLTPSLAHDRGFCPAFSRRLRRLGPDDTQIARERRADNTVRALDLTEAPQGYMRP